LLYLVSRALERPTDPQATEVPLVGMAHFADEVVGRRSYRNAVEALSNGRLIWSPSASPADSRSDSSSHGGFDDDNPTMTSVMLRILGTTTVRPENEYVPNLLPGTSAGAIIDAATEIADRPPEVVTVEVHEGTKSAAEPPAAAAAPPSGVEASAARRTPAGTKAFDNRVIEALIRSGWKTTPPDERPG
jgi:hypothetical protein